jgi:hypothetical protein
MADDEQPDADDAQAPDSDRASRSERTDETERTNTEPESPITPDPTAPKPRRRPPAAGRGIAPAPTHVIEKRVATIARALVDGLGRAAIVQAVARDQQRERVERGKARLAGATDERELNALVPFVWGDEPIPQRTIEHYMSRARGILSDEGKQVSRQREYVLAIQLARLNETYMAAFQAKRFHTCLGVLKEINQMFSMRDAIKTLLMAEARAQSDAEQEKSGKSLRTEEARAATLSTLIQRASAKDPALSRLFANFAALNSVAAMPATPSASAPSKKPTNGSNGSR